ncbi:MAG: hypothetical protein IJ635_01340 [Bacteroidaceae bacterium]|nr:hypothetical protein [Bacteroidaceae bacterium]
MDLAEGRAEQELPTTMAQWARILELAYIIQACSTDIGLSWRKFKVRAKKQLSAEKVLQQCNFFATFAVSTKSWIYEKDFFYMSMAAFGGSIGTNEDGQGDGLERVECGQGG